MINTKFLFKKCIIDNMRLMTLINYVVKRYCLVGVLKIMMTLMKEKETMMMMKQLDIIFLQSKTW